MPESIFGDKKFFTLWEMQVYLFEPYKNLF